MTIGDPLDSATETNARAPAIRPLSDRPPATRMTADCRPRFCDAQSRPIPGVEVRIDGPDGVALGRSDGEGHIESVSDLRGSRLHASASGYASHTWTYDCSQSVVVLRSESWLVGRTVDHNGTPIPDVRVVAWARGQGAEAGRAAARRAWTGSGTEACARTDENGRFRIGGLAPGRVYQMAAGREGWIAAESEKTCRAAPSDGFEIVLLPAYGARIQLLDPAGLPVENQSGLEPSLQHGVIGGTNVPGAFPVVAGAGAILAGVPTEALEKDTTSELWVFVWDREAATLGPVECEVHVSDHAPHESLVVLPRLSSRVESIPIRLQPADEPWMAVRVEFYDSTTGEPASTAPTGRLVMKSKDREFAFRTSSTDVPAAWFRVPRGTYGARFRSSAGIWTYPPLGDLDAIVDVSSDGASIRIPVEPPGSLEVVPQPESALSWVRQMHVVLANRAQRDAGQGRLELNWDSSIAISGPPFRLNGIRAGTYMLLVLEPRDAVPHTAEVVISAGRSTELRVRLADAD